MEHGTGGGRLRGRAGSVQPRERARGGFIADRGEGAWKMGQALPKGTQREDERHQGSPA